MNNIKDVLDKLDIIGQQKKCTHQIIQIGAHKTSDKNIITYDQPKIDVQQVKFRVF